MSNTERTMGVAIKSLDGQYVCLHISDTTTEGFLKVTASNLGAAHRASVRELEFSIRDVESLWIRKGYWPIIVASKRRLKCTSYQDNAIGA